MAQEIVMQAQLREETGKNEMRRLRKSGLVPGIIFGRSGETAQVSFEPRELDKVIHSEAGFNTIFTIDVEGLKEDNKRQVLIKEYQLDPVTHNFIHVSFYRVRADREIEVNIPIVTEGEPVGVKDQGGSLDIVMRDIQVRCLPGDIPESIHVNVTGLHIGDQVRVSELTIPDKVELLEDTDAVVLHCVPPRKVAVVEEIEEEEEAAEEEAAEAGEEETEE